MSISNNTTKLQNLMNKINALPEAGSGGENLDEVISEQDSLISQIQEAVNGLPEAGSGESGGNGGSIEAWTGAITANMIGAEYTVHYTDETFAYCTEIIGFGNDTVITIAANTIIYIPSIGYVYGDVTVFDENNPYGLLPTKNDFYISID